MKRQGIEGIYLGGWATSAKGSVTEDPGPDLASYPLSQVPDEAAPIVRALITADRNQCFARRRMTEAHVAVHRRDPQTFAYAMADSPAGLGAYLWHRRQIWCDGDALEVHGAEAGRPGQREVDRREGVTHLARLVADPLTGGLSERAGPTGRAPALDPAVVEERTDVAGAGREGRRAVAAPEVDGGEVRAHRFGSVAAVDRVAQAELAVLVHSPAPDAAPGGEDRAREAVARAHGAELERGAGRLVAVGHRRPGDHPEEAEHHQDHEGRDVSPSPAPGRSPDHGTLPVACHHTVLQAVAERQGVTMGKPKRNRSRWSRRWVSAPRSPVMCPSPTSVTS